MDLGSDPVRGASLTGADVGDSLAADALVQGDEAAVFAAKAHDAMVRREALAGSTHASNGIADGIVHRGHTRRRLAPWQRWMDAVLALIHGQVGRAFGTLRRSMAGAGCAIVASPAMAPTCGCSASL